MTAILTKENTTDFTSEILKASAYLKANVNLKTECTGSVFLAHDQPHSLKLSPQRSASTLTITCSLEFPIPINSDFLVDRNNDIIRHESNSPFYRALLSPVRVL